MIFTSRGSVVSRFACTSFNVVMLLVFAIWLADMDSASFHGFHTEFDGARVLIPGAFLGVARELHRAILLPQVSVLVIETGFEQQFANFRCSESVHVGKLMGLDPLGIGSSFCLLFLKKEKNNEYLVRKSCQLIKNEMFKFGAKTL